MRSLPIFVMATSLLFACKKEKQETKNPEEDRPPVVVEDSTDYSAKSEYLPMEVGNYWVYDVYEIDSLGNERLLDYKDSTVITNDTLLPVGHYYWFDNFRVDQNSRINNTDLWDGSYKDSLKNKVDRNGNVIFSENRINQVINVNKIPEEYPDTLMYIESKMLIPNGLISVPAGDFETLNYRGDVYRPHECEDHPKSPKHTNTYYAKNVGLIKHSYFYLSSCNTYFERRLVRYHIEE